MNLRPLFDRILTPPNSSRYHLDEWARSAGRYAEARGWLVLDAGCGAAPYRHHFDPSKYETADFAEVDKAYTKDLTYRCTLDAIPVADGRFDMVFCSQVLEHVPDPRSVLRELHRVVKPGGEVWMSAPLMYEEHEKPYDYFRYTQFAWRLLAADTDFDVKTLEWLEGYYGTLSWQLKTAAQQLSTFWLPVRAVFLGLAYVFAELDRRHPRRDIGIPKNYRTVLTPR